MKHEQVAAYRPARLLALPVLALPVLALPVLALARALEQFCASMAAAAPRFWGRELNRSALWRPPNLQAGLGALAPRTRPGRRDLCRLLEASAARRAIWLLPGPSLWQAGWRVHVTRWRGAALMPLERS